METSSQALAGPELTYPESDGRPMADNTKQFAWIVLIKEGLEALFADRQDVFVAGDLLWYPLLREGETPAAPKAPDVLVVFGRPKGHRGAYVQAREESITPQVVFEVLSPNNTEQERQRAEQERQRAEQERQRAERLTAQLRQLGIEPDESS